VNREICFWKLIADLEWELSPSRLVSSLLLMSGLLLLLLLLLLVSWLLVSLLLLLSFLAASLLLVLRLQKTHVAIPMNEPQIIVR